MTVICVATWILLSALLVTVLCKNSGRISRMEEHEENMDQD